MNICKNCGTEFEGNFCTECGAKFSPLRICRSCGGVVTGKFCGKCGTRYEDEPETEYDDSSDVTLSSRDSDCSGWSKHLAFSLEDDGYRVEGKGGCTDSDVFIPPEYNGKPVIMVRDYAFWDCPDLKSVTIPESVTSIGFKAFSNCRYLTRITIPSSVTFIGERAFCGCTSLISIVIPRSLSYIGNFAFSSCTVLESIYYSSTIDEWSKNITYDFNRPFRSPTIYFYSERRPYMKGNFWQYVDGEPAIWPQN